MQGLGLGQVGSRDGIGFEGGSSALEPLVHFVPSDRLVLHAAFSLVLLRQCRPGLAPNARPEVGLGIGHLVPRDSVSFLVAGVGAGLSVRPDLLDEVEVVVEFWVAVVLLEVESRSLLVLRSVHIWLVFEERAVELHEFFI